MALYQSLQAVGSVFRKFAGYFRNFLQLIRDWSGKHLDGLFDLGNMVLIVRHNEAD